MEQGRRPLTIDLGKLDPQAGLTEALRLLAAAEGNMETFIAEAARIVTELFHDLDLEGVDDETLSALGHRIVEGAFGTAIAANEAVTLLVESTGKDRNDVLRAAGGWH